MYILHYIITWSFALAIHSKQNIFIYFIEICKRSSINQQKINRKTELQFLSNLTCFSLRSYTCLIFFFWDFTGCNFSILNSFKQKKNNKNKHHWESSEKTNKYIKMHTSSVETKFSLAFSSASWWINRTVSWILLETSGLLIFESYDK